jgi:hypothetical protein
MKTLVEMLREKDFTFFTKETLYIITRDNHRSLPPIDTESMTEVFEIISLLKKFQKLQRTPNHSYSVILYNKMLNFKYLLPKFDAHVTFDAEDEGSPIIIEEDLRESKQGLNSDLELYRLKSDELKRPGRKLMNNKRRPSTSVRISSSLLKS